MQIISLQTFPANFSIHHGSCLQRSSLCCSPKRDALSLFCIYWLEFRYEGSCSPFFFILVRLMNAYSLGHYCSWFCCSDYSTFGHASFSFCLLLASSIFSEAFRIFWSMRCSRLILHFCCWEKAMAPHFSTLAWKIPWTEEPGRLQSMGSRRVGHDWATSLSLFTLMHWRRRWQPTLVFLPGESQGQGSLVGCRLWGRTESDTTEAT